MKVIDCFAVMGLCFALLFFCGCASQGQNQQTNVGGNILATDHLSVEYPKGWVVAKEDNYSALFLFSNESSEDAVENVIVVAFPVPEGFPNETEAIKQRFVDELSGYNQSSLSYGACNGDVGSQVCNFIYSFEYNNTVIKRKQVVFFKEGVMCQTIYSATPETYDTYQRSADQLTATLKCF